MSEHRCLADANGQESCVSASASRDSLAFGRVIGGPGTVPLTGGGAISCSCLAGVVLSFVFVGVTAAHQPTISDGTAITPESAIFFDDIQLSRVVYHEVTDEAPQLWIAFEVTEPQSLRISLGVPYVDRLESFRPAFAVLGPGWPDIDLPFDVEINTTGLLFTTDAVTDPEVFHEPFSGTSSWIVREEDVDLPQAGTYYIVAYVPSGENGKLWLAPGVREEFSLADIVELGDVVGEVQAFHEVMPGGFPCFLIPAVGTAVLLPMLLLIRRRAGASRNP